MTDYWQRAKEAYETMLERKKQEAIDEFKTWFGDDVPVTGARMNSDYTVYILFDFEGEEMSAGWQADYENTWTIVFLKDGEWEAAHMNEEYREPSILYKNCKALKNRVHKKVERERRRGVIISPEKRKLSWWQRLWN